MLEWKNKFNKVESICWNTDSQHKNTWLKHTCIIHNISAVQIPQKIGCDNQAQQYQERVAEDLINLIFKCRATVAAVFQTGSSVPSVLQHGIFPESCSIHTPGMRKWDKSTTASIEWTFKLLIFCRRWLGRVTTSQLPTLDVMMIMTRIACCPVFCFALPVNNLWLVSSENRTFRCRGCCNYFTNCKCRKALWINRMCCYEKKD